MGNLPSTREFDKGLLEQPALIVSALSDAGRRTIFDLDHREVGFAAWDRRSWWRGHTLSIHEREDSPLVFTVARRWMWPFRREVRDAEGELIGELAGRRVLDRWGDAVMRREHEHLTDLHGVVLARWSRGKAGSRLEFRPSVRSDPFACMLVLAAMLI